jgi:adhesin transport system membrane fusion protein
MSNDKRHTFDALLHRQGETSWRLNDRRMVVLLVLILLWTIVGQVDRVITAQGKIIPQDRIKVIQHLEGGIIKNVGVKENQMVKAGDSLIELDLASTGANGGEMSARMLGLQLSKKRLEAESKGYGEPAWDTTLAPEFQDILKAEKATYKARRDEHQNTLAALEGQIVQGQHRVAEMRARLESLEAGMKISQKELEISESLVKDKLVSQLDHYQRKSTFERAQGELSATRQALPGALAAVEEAAARKREEESKYRRRATDELSEVERKISSLHEELNRAQDQEGRAVIRAPIDGVVKNIRYQSPGNVVKPGEPIMEVVPLKEQLVVEVRVIPSDRGFINVGQKATVKVSAYDFFRYGGLEGQVTSIAADTDAGKNDEQFFRVVITTQKSWLGDQPGQFPISAGMMADVDIHAQSQSIIWMLLRPVLKLKHEAFREI